VTDVVVAGVGMHPWGKWGRNFVEYGVVAARAALADAGIDYRDVQFVSGADTVRNGYPGYVAGATFAQALGWTGARVASSYAACASGATALEVARAEILAGRIDVALVVGADTTPKGFLAPNAGDRPDDPDWLRFRLLGATNPTYFALYARRRMALYGATERDFAEVRAKNARHGLENPNARYRKDFSVEDILGSPMVADPLRLVEICATSDGGAAVVLTSADYARSRTAQRTGVAKPVRVRAVSTVTPAFPQTVIEMPNFSTDSGAAVTDAVTPFKDSIAKAAYEECGLGPEDLSLAEVYDRRADPGEPLGRVGLLRRGGAGAGTGAGVRGDVAAARPGGRAAGRRRDGRPDGEPGPVRPRLVRHPLPVTTRGMSALCAPMSRDRHFTATGTTGPPQAAT
jgi:acetyl-CoA acetyltransferase